MWSSFKKNILILSPTSATRRISAVSEDHSCIPYWSDSVLVWQAFIVDWQTTSETENRAWFVIIYMYYVLIAEILTLFLPASRLSYKGPWWIIKNAENCMVSNIKTKCTNVKLDNKTHTWYYRYQEDQNAWRKNKAWSLAHQYEAIEGQSSLFLGYNQYNHNSKEKLFYLNTSSKRN